MEGIRMNLAVSTYIRTCNERRLGLKMVTRVGRLRQIYAFDRDGERGMRHTHQMDLAHSCPKTEGSLVLTFFRKSNACRKRHIVRWSAATQVRDMLRKAGGVPLDREDV